MDDKRPESVKDRELQNLREENRRLRERFALLSHLSSHISADLDLSTVLQNVIDAACELTGASYGALAMVDSSGHIQEFITHGITLEERQKIGPPPQGLGLLGLLQHVQEPLRLADISKHPRSVGFPPNHPAMKTFLGAPLRHGDEALGNLYLTEKSEGGEFNEEDEKLLVLFAAQAAMAIKNAQRFVREQEALARLHAIINSSAAGIVVADAQEGKVILANKEAARILGFSLDSGDLRERYENAAVYFKPDGSPYDLDELPLQRALKEGATSRSIEVLFDLPNERRIPTLVNAAPVYDSDGEISAAVAVIEDISNRQELEQLKSDFLSMVSHDLRSPLATIKGLATGLLMDRGPRDMETILDYLRSIDEEVDYTSELVGNLLDMSRIEAGAMPLDPETCHLADIASECVRRIERSRLGGRHKIVVDIPLELPEIYADYDQISRVLSNLLSNAIKYSPEGSEVLLKSFVDPEDQNEIVTMVKDQGIGIPEGEIGKIFDKFYRVASQRAREARRGSGLGLPICKTIVESHNGKIWVMSEQGKGSTFYFRLPILMASIDT